MWRPQALHFRQYKQIKYFFIIFRKLHLWTFSQHPHSASLHPGYSTLLPTTPQRHLRKLTFESALTTWPFRIPNNSLHFSIEFFGKCHKRRREFTDKRTYVSDVVLHFCSFHKRADLRTWLFSQISFLRKARTVKQTRVYQSTNRDFRWIPGNFQNVLMSQSWLVLFPLCSKNISLNSISDRRWLFFTQSSF